MGNRDFREARLGGPGSHGAPCSPAERSRGLDRLQDAVGNRAVASLLDHRDAGLQRSVVPNLVQLQRAAGNRAVGSLVSAQRIFGIGEGLTAAADLVSKATAPKDLRRGDKGWRVNALQIRLNSQGATPPLKIDGIFGRKTKKAVVELQQLLGIKASGVVTKELREVLALKVAPADRASPWGESKKKTFPILLDGKEVMVDEDRYNAEGGKLLIKYVTLVNAVTEDAIAVVKEYKLAKIKSLYTEPLEDLKSAAQSLSKGNLVWAARHMKRAGGYKHIAERAQKMYFDMGVVSYVGSHIDQATIGFFEGSANALLGMVDMGGAVLGYDPGLVNWNTRQYGKIKSGYAAASNGVDPDSMDADEIGRTAGQVATGIATVKVAGGAGVAGAGMVAAAGVGGLIKVAGGFKMQHDVMGRSWSDIFADPTNMAQAVGAIAGAMGLGAAAFPAYRQFLGEVGLVVSAGQIGVTAGALFRLSQDKTLSADQMRDRTLQLIGDGIQNLAMTADAARAPRKTTDAPPGGRAGPKVIGSPNPRQTIRGTGAILFGRVMQQVKDVDQARVMYAQMHSSNEPHSLISDRHLADRFWRQDSGQISHPPVAWMTADGVTHFVGPALGIKTSPFARLPELATNKPIYGSVVRVINDVPEAYALYRRFWLDGENILEAGQGAPQNQLPAGFHPNAYLDQQWFMVDGQGNPPIAWVRYGDGVVFFNWSEVPRPAVHGTSKPKKKIDRDDDVGRQRGRGAAVQ